MQFSLMLLQWTDASCNNIKMHCSVARFASTVSSCRVFHSAAAAVKQLLSVLCCPADLFTGNGGQIAVGVVLVLLLPVGFLVISGFFIWRYLYHPRTPQRRAAFIMLEDPHEPVVCYCPCLSVCQFRSLCFCTSGCFGVPST